MTGLAIRWSSIFADVPAADFESERVFWQQVAAARAGEPRGARGEFLPLRPDGGDPVVWLQRVDRPAERGGWHLDQHVPDVEAAAQSAVHLGASIERQRDGLVTLSSPAGQPFCVVVEDSGRVRCQGEATTWPEGYRTRVDQLCMDIPASVFDDEGAFWSELTGWSRRHGERPEFDNLLPPLGLPVRILLQRLEGAGDRIGAHADLACDDVPAETARHEALGAKVVRLDDAWTTMRDPAGLTYCITSRRAGDGQ
jgi:hypothetical protein